MTEISAVFEKIKEYIQDHDIVLFMKGSSHMPMCGFSAAVVQIFKKLEIPFKDVNVLENEALRQGIKEFTDWPTIPQLYIKGEFIGGCDIIRDMFTAGEFEDLLKEKGIPFKVQLS
jgi:monothiol glutaredoxin